MKRFIHDKLTMLLLLLVIVASMFMALLGEKNSAVLNQNIYYFDSQTYKVYYYIFTINMEYESDENQENEAGELSGDMAIPNVKGNLILLDYGDWRLGDTFDTFSANIYLTYSEVPLQQMQEGRYPTVDEIERGDKCVVLGVGMLPFTTVRGTKRYFVVDGTEFYVTGILKDITSSGEDSRVELFYNSLSHTEKTAVANGMYELHREFFYKSIEQTEAEDQIILEWLNREYKGISSAVDDLSGDEEAVGRTVESGSLSELTVALYQLSAKIEKLIYIFGLVSCLLVMQIWKRRKKREMNIRTLLGETPGVIYLKYSLQMLMICGMGTLFAIGVFLLSSVINKNFMTAIQISWIKILLQFGFVYLTTLAVVLSCRRKKGR